MMLSIVLFVLFSVGVRTQSLRSGSQSSFFLQDVNDGLCLAAGNYIRCSAKTLWYVTGKSGSYQIHPRAAEPMELAVDAEDPDQCLIRENCGTDSESALGIGPCEHCGANKWSIVGDAATGFVLTENENKNCVLRQGGVPALVDCKTGYSSFSLKFMTKDDMKHLNSPTARLVAAAFEGDAALVHSLLADGVDVNARDWDRVSPVIAAASSGSLELVTRLVSAGADVDYADNDNVTALLQASFGGHLEVVEYLLPLVADVDAVAISGVSALWLAASEGYTEVVTLLLARGANHSNQRTDGIDAVMVASAGGHADAVALLLQAGASAVGRDRDGLTALASGCENGSLPVVQLLVEAGADVDLLTESGFSPLIIAAAHGHLPLVQYLVDSAGAALDVEHPQGITPLMYAAAGGFVPTIEFLLTKEQARATLNHQHSSGGAALSEAATAGHSEAVQLLLAAGADPLVSDKDGVTPLMAAAAEGHTDTCKLLISAAGESVNTVAKSGGTALMFAAGEGKDSTVALLLESGADSNIAVEADAEYIEEVSRSIAEGVEGVEPHKNGVTALMLAALGGHETTVRLLVEKGGASVVAVDDEEMTALANAAKNKHFSICAYLLQHGANPNDSFMDEEDEDGDGSPHNLLLDALVAGDSELALLLIDKGADTSVADSDGVTPLTQAAFQGLTNVVQSLLDHHAEVSVVSHEGVNALIAASSEGHTEIIEMLLKTGQANVDLKDKDGTTSLMAGAVRGYKDTVAVLLSHGANVNLQNIDGHTALMFAYNGKNQVQTLLDRYNEFMGSEGIQSVEGQNAQQSVTIINEALVTHVEIIRLLLEYGADTEIKDNEGHVALDFDYQPPEERVRGDADEADSIVSSAEL